MFEMLDLDNGVDEADGEFAAGRREERFAGLTDVDIETLTRDIHSDPATWAGHGDQHEPPDCSAIGLPVELSGLLLTALDPAAMTGVGKIRILQAQARLVAHHQARVFESMVAILDEYECLAAGDVVEGMEAAVAEIRAAMMSTRRAAESDVDLAWRLRDRLPGVLEALRRGDLDLRRVRVIVDGTNHMEACHARSVADEVIDRAPRLTTGQLRALIRRLCIDVDPDDARTRYEASVGERAVIAEQTEHGTATITASDLPADRVASVMHRLDRIAEGLRGPHEARTMDQLRADAFLDMLEGAGSPGPRAVVDIRVDLTTLLELDDRSAELAGFGPVIADVARQVAGVDGSQWRVTVADGAGRVVHSGVTRRRPPAALRRRVEARDGTCVFPGCRVPASSCDLDHRVPVAEGGSTHEDQLVALCRHDHVIRHRHGWAHVRNSDGSHTWTSPLGATYTRPPPI